MNFQYLPFLATQAKGITTVSGAGELRLKESDRIESMEKFIKTLGGEIEVNPDGFKVTGPQKLKSGQIKTF